MCCSRRAGAITSRRSMRNQRQRLAGGQMAPAGNVRARRDGSARCRARSCRRSRRPRGEPVTPPQKSHRDRSARRRRSTRCRPAPRVLRLAMAAGADTPSPGRRTPAHLACHRLADNGAPVQRRRHQRLQQHHQRGGHAGPCWRTRIPPALSGFPAGRTMDRVCWPFQNR